MQNRAPLPNTRAFLLADSILTEAGTHKKSLIGIHSRIVAARVPLRKRLNVYAQLSDAFGSYQFTLEVAHLRTGKTCSQGEFGPIVARDRLQPLEIVMNLPCVLEEYGDYEIRIAYMGNVFASRIFSVIEMPAFKPGMEGKMPPFGLPEDDSFPESWESDT